MTRNAELKRGSQRGVKTCAEVGKELGISKQRVDQIYQKAIAKIRANIAADEDLLEDAARLLGVHPDVLRASLEG